MLRYNANSRLFKYTTEEKKRYKLYKRKKVWVVAGMSLFSTATLVQQVSADEAPLTNTTAQNDVEDENSQSDAVINASEVRENASSRQTVESSVPEKEQVSESNEQTLYQKRLWRISKDRRIYCKDGMAEKRKLYGVFPIL